VDTYCNETLIDYATELNIAFLIGSKFLFSVTSKESQHLTWVVYYQHEQLERFCKCFLFLWKSNNVFVYVKHIGEYEFTHRDGYCCMC